MGDVVLLSLVSAINPTLIATTTIMLLLPRAERLMLGYWLGAILISITLGLLIVFDLQSSSLVNTTKKTLSPISDLALGLIALSLSWALQTGRDRRITEHRAKPKKHKGPPKWQQALAKGNATTTFVIGALLTLPGVSYLAALDRLSKLDYSTVATVLVVIGFNLVMLLLIEGPLIAFAVAPQKTPIAIDHAKTWGRTHARTYGARALALIGIALLIKGLIGLLT